MANASGDENSYDDGGRRRRHDNGGGGGGVTPEAAGGDALIGTWAKAEAVDAAPAIFSDAGARTWIFLHLLRGFRLARAEGSLILTSSNP